MQIRAIVWVIFAMVSTAIVAPMSVEKRKFENIHPLYFWKRIEVKMDFHNAQSSGTYRDDINKYGPKNLYDGNTGATDMDSGSCFHSQSNSNVNTYDAWVQLDSEEAMFITSINILNRDSDYPDSYKRIKGMTVWVCPDSTKKDCKLFQTVEETPKAAAEWIELPRKTEKLLKGATILFKHKRIINFCEVIVKGFKWPLTQMIFHNALSSGTYKDDRMTYGPNHLYDGDTRSDMDSGSCFHSQSKSDLRNYDAWVQLDSKETLFITNIYILNRNSEYAYQRIKGLTVWVCPNSTKSDCKQFGTVNETKKGDWIGLSKSEMGMEGATLLLKHNNTINICEVKVFGTKSRSVFCEEPRYEVSSFEASGPCKCECGESEQTETRTCTWKEKPGCPNPCDAFILTRKIKCEKKCSKNLHWIDAYADVGECQMSPDYLCGQCKNGGLQKQSRKCKAFMKSDSGCTVIKTEDPSRCGLDQPKRTIPCTLSQPKPCIIDQLKIFTYGAYATDLQYSAHDQFDNKCYIGTFLPNHDDIKASTDDGYTVYTDLRKHCPDVCLDQKGFKQMLVKNIGKDPWRGNLTLVTNGVPYFYKNNFEWIPQNGEQLYFADWRLE